MAKHLESEHQQSLFEWAEMMARSKYPELRWMFAIPNGGRRNVIEAVRLKKEGVKKGVPDLCLPVARGGYHGLYVEMKAGKNKPSAEQTAYLKFLASEGYYVGVCYDWRVAKAGIETYLKLERGTNGKQK